MRRVLTAAEMREVDRRTIEESGIPGLILMETAAARVVEALIERYGPLSDQRILILCGKGNNGGDGLAVARQLTVRGLAAPLVLLATDPKDLKGDAAVNLRMLQAVGDQPLIVNSLADWKNLYPKTLPATIVLDGLLGTGLNGPARGFAAELIADLRENFTQAAFVAVDIPSGMPSNSGEPAEPAMPADLTVTFTAPKISQVFPPNCLRLGELRVAAIGTTDRLLADVPGQPLWLSEASDFVEFFQDRPADSHKGGYGHVAVIAGSRSKAGAALLAGTAAARGGAGLTTIVTAEGAATAIVGSAPELMTEPVEELADGSIGEASFDAGWFDRKNVVVVGPGLGIAEPNRKLVEQVLSYAKLPVVADADALTALAQAGDDIWDKRPETLILTPHPGEMSRLTGLSTAQVQADRLGAARDFAAKRNVVLVLKGFRTLVACPDGRVFVNPTGTPGMSTGGSGDVLTGLIAGLLVQFPEAPPERVAAAAVYLHGLAGEKAAAALGEKSMLAGDILDALPDAIAAVRAAAL